jgi:CBS domain-containing protein
VSDACVGDVMTRAVICVRKDVPVRALLSLLLEQHIGGAPVVDDAGVAIGVVSTTDVLQAVEAGRDLATTTVDEVMTPLAFTLYEDASLARAAALMATEGIHRLPVIAHGGGVVGIVTPFDVTRWLAATSATGASRSPSTPAG